MSFAAHDKSTAQSTHSEAKEGHGTGLAADVDDVVGVRKAIELSGGALGVGTHILKIEPVTNIKDGVETGALRDAVNTIAGGAPNGVLEALAHGGGVGSRSIVEGLSTSAENLGDGVLVVEHDVGKVAVDAVVDVDHVALAVQSGVLDGATSDDVASNGECRGDIVAARLGNDLNVAVGREKLVQSAAEDAGHGLEAVAAEAATDVKGAQVEPEFMGPLEDQVSIADSLVVGQGVRGAGADVEADTYDVETEFLGESEEALGGVHGSSKLHAEAAQAFAIVGHDAEEELGAGEELGDLVQLIGIIKGHLLDARGLDESDVGVGLAGLGVDDAVGAEAHAENLFDLCLGGTVEAGTKLREELDDLGVRVAFDGLNGG